MALIFAGVAALIGLLIYHQARDGSATRHETTPGARSGAFDARRPAAPPMPYRFAGTSFQNGATQYLLARDDRVFPVTVGAILDGVYRVESIGEREIALRYLPLELRQVVSLNVAPWPPTVEAVSTSNKPAERDPLPPAVQRTRSPELLELSR